MAADSATCDGEIVDTTQYQVSRKDRWTSRGGGVMVLAPSHLACHRRYDLEQDSLEAIFVEFRNSRSKFLLACIYIPPHEQTLVFETLQISIDKLVEQRSSYTSIYLLGDFNVHIDWSDLSSPIPSTPASQQLLEMMEPAGFRSPAGKESQLDLCFTTNPTLVSDCYAQDSLLGCDHKAIHIHSYTSFPRQGRFARMVHRYAQTDFTHLCQLLHLAPWSMVLTESSPNDMYELWLDFMAAIQAETVPHFHASKKRRPPWITNDIVKIARRKRQLFNRARERHCQSSYTEAKKLQREMKRLVHISHQDYVTSIAARAAKEPKLFWAYIRSQRKSSSPSHPSFKHNHRLVSDPSTIATLFSEHFSSIWSPPEPPTPSLPPVPSSPPPAPASIIDSPASSPQPILSSLSITEQDVYDSVSSIRTAQNPGPDQVHPAFFKLSVPVIKPILTIMFQRLLDSGTVPSAWRRSIITPVHKGGGFGTDTTDSYRPIASTSIVCRTLERIINKKILDHMEDNGLFSPAQHGFRRRHSYETALAVAVHTLSTITFFHRIYGPSAPPPVFADSVASLDHPEAPVNVTPLEDMDLQATETSAGQPGSLSLTGNTAAAPAAAVAAPPSIIIRPHTNPFAPLMDLEHAQHEEGKLLDLSSNVRVISTAKHGQKRARGTLSSVSTAASTRNVMSTNQTRGVEMETAPTPSDASTQDSTLEESDWQRVTYRRKKNSTLASASSSSGRPMYQHTLKIDKQHDLPKFLTRYLNRSNQIAVDAAETRVRDALVTIDHLPIKGQVVPFQAYETIRHGQIRGIIRNAGGMLATELMQNLHCRKCEILSARPLGDNGTALITFRSNSLPYRIGLRSFTVPVFPFKAKILVCDTCHKMGHRKEQCPNQSSPSRSPSRRQRNSRRKSTVSPPSLPEQRPKATATSRNFYTGPTSLPVAPTNEDSSKLTFASVVAAINAPTSQQSALTPPPPLSNTSAPRATPQTTNEQLQQTETALPVTSLQPPSSGKHQHQLPQADLDQRLVQREQTILQKVQQAIENAIERCVRTAIEKLMFAGMFPFGAAPQQTLTSSTPSPTALEALSGAVDLLDRDLVELPYAAQEEGRRRSTPSTSKRERHTIIALQEVNGPLLRLPGYDGYLPHADQADPTKTALTVWEATTSQSASGFDMAPKQRDAIIPVLESVTHWDKYRLALDEEPPKASIELLTQQLHEAKTAATKGLRVSQDHPDPDRHLLALWIRRLRLLTAYRKRGKPRRTKRRLRKIQNEIERYTTEEIFKARHYRRAYLLATANPLLTPFPPSQLFSRRQLVTLRQIQTGTILTPYLLQRFRQHRSSHCEKGRCAATTNLPGTCALRHVNADLEHLLWDCPLYSEPRTRTLATTQQSFRPTSLHAWACPDPSFPKVIAIELWRSLLAYIQDPAAPPVGTRLQGIQLSNTEPRQNTMPEPTVHSSSDAVAPTGPTNRNGGPLSPDPVP
ncbi:hypothetical protein HPB47_001267 [Ixodes persulcatus]|uniref:Uncharacterized protein n=1 Tax=Ixodes persulcatus TaxID=34615 RepID=A0AC60PQU6_IXOPE|nr:hypothetical protein HPB47_001267 [Ixodes persulcatus]